MGKTFDRRVARCLRSDRACRRGRGHETAYCGLRRIRLMLASNFRFATEDADVSELERPIPDWLATVVADIARDNRWADDWFNDGVAFHLSPLADRAADHLEFGTFPRDG